MKIAGQGQRSRMATNAQAITQLFTVMREKSELTDRIFYDLVKTRTVFNPRINVNKFVTGGVAEELMVDHITQCGFRVENLAETATVTDICVYVPLLDDPGFALALSLKNCGSLTACPILENYRGNCRKAIRPLPPTIIIYTDAEKRIARYVYLDYALLRSVYPDLTEDALNTLVYKQQDSNLSFRSGFLNAFISKLPDVFIVNATYPTMTGLYKGVRLSNLILTYIRTLQPTPKKTVRLRLRNRDPDNELPVQNHNAHPDDGHTFPRVRPNNPVLLPRGTAT